MPKSCDPFRLDQCGQEAKPTPSYHASVMGDKSSTSLQDEITLIPSPENHAELATPNEHTVAVPSPQDGINEATLLVENDEGESFQEGDQKIRDLEAENKRLKTTLSQKTLEYDELVQELERHIELVETLRAKLSSYESRRREQPSSAAKVLQRRKPVPIHNNTVGRTPTSKSSGRAISHAKGLSAKQPLNAAAAARTEDLQPHAISTNSDDICAALSCFVEENKMNLLGLGNFGHADGGVSRLINSQAHLENTLEQLSKFVTDGDYTTLEQTSDNGQEMSVPKHASGKPHRGKQDQQANLFSFLLENSGGGSSGGNLVRDDDDYFADDFDEEYQLGSDPFYAQSKKSASSRARSVHALSHLFQPTVMKPLSEEETKIIDLMQARMARNVASLGTRPLNTMEIAKQCKRLMVAYNIGQRLFAKAVMREVVKSQGSLSELLSKPRAWHKLTDKGREAFRRIYGWLSDDTAIELLCSLSPRRISMPCDKIEHPTSDSLIELRDEGDGMDGVLLGEYSGEPSSNAASDEHLDSIINSTIDKVRMSSMAVKQVKAEIEGREVTSGETPFSSVPAILVTMSGGAIPITTTKSSSSHPPSSSSSSRWRHDDIPREKIIDIYEAEKAKLESQELCVDIGGGSSSVPPKRSNSTSSKRGGSVESAVAQPVVPVPQPKQQHHFTRSSTQVLVSPLPASGELESGVICGRFPAKQTKEPTPILQEQLEKYPQLDTEEVVKQIKDWLSDTSTSQRQFGESVLGLSQGSVSDLLARPKPWNQLTHKGREPFIRMKMFLEDNVHSGILLGENTSERGEDSSREVSQPSGVDPTGSEVVGQQGCDMLSKVKDEPLSEISLLAEEEAQEEGFYVDDDDINDDDEVQGNGHDRASPRCGEETLDTAELAKKIKMYLADTGISQRAFGEHVLHTNSGTTSELLCRPKAWTEASSELRLPEKSRDAYTRMRNFLEDAAAKQALKAGNAKSLRALFPSTISTSISPNNHSTFGNAIADVANSMTVKEMLTSGLFGGGKKTIRVIPPTKQSALQPTQALDTTPMPLKRKALEDDPTPLTQAYEQQDYVTSGGPVKKMPRFQRTIITDKQKEALLYVYLHEQRPTTKTIDQIAVALGLSSRTVTNWFHNFRTRQKAKELKLMSEGLEPPKLPTISATAEALEGELWFLDIVEILARNRRLENDGGNGGEAIDDLFPTMMPTEQGSPKLELALDTSGESETTAEDASIVSSKSSRQSQGQSRNGGMMNGGRSQLDRAIARMHDRLSSGAA